MIFFSGFERLFKTFYTSNAKDRMVCQKKSCFCRYATSCLVAHSYFIILSREDMGSFSVYALDCPHENTDKLMTQRGANCLFMTEQDTESASIKS